MCFSKVQQSDCYTQLCNYREKFVLKPISKYFYELQFIFH